jgi:hypothetical protein
MLRDARIFNRLYNEAETYLQDQGAQDPLLELSLNLARAARDQPVKTDERKNECPCHHHANMKFGLNRRGIMALFMSARIHHRLYIASARVFSP